MKTYGKGTKIYWNSCFSGLVKGEIVSLTRLPYTSGIEVTIKITAKNVPPYRSGELFITSASFVFPRECYHKTGIFTFFVDEYKWSDKLYELSS